MQNTVKKMVFLVVIMTAGLFAEALGPFTSTPATGVAPTCNEPVLFQRFPAAVFGNTVYLAVWADGERKPGQKSTEIYCARIDSTTGQSLDPAGILICNANFNQSHPAVAFDGTNFLVVWEDFRNNHDYDVYGARVSEAGTVLDPNGFVISAVKDTNEVRPAVGFANETFFVAWADARRYPVYGIWGARVTSAGEVLDKDGIVIDAEAQSTIDLKKPANGRITNYSQDGWWGKLVSNYSVVMSSSESGCYLAYMCTYPSGSENPAQALKTAKLDPKTGQFLVTPKIDSQAKYAFDIAGICTTPQGVAVSPALSQPGFAHGLQVFCQRFDTNLVSNDNILMSGYYFLEPQPRIIFFNIDYGSGNSIRGENCMNRFTLGFDGKNIVYAMEQYWWKEKNTTISNGILLCRSSLTGDALLDTTLIRVDESSKALGTTNTTVYWPSIASGPNNSCLLLYEKCVAINNRQVVARVLREN